MPEATYSHASWKAVDELAQAFSVLIIGNALDAHVPQDNLSPHALLALRKPGRGVADDGHLRHRLVDSRGLERRLDRLACQALEIAVQVLPEAGHARTYDCYLSHGMSLPA